MDAVRSHHFQSAADSPSGIIFKPDIFDYGVTRSNTRAESESTPIAEGQQPNGTSRGLPKGASPKTASPRAKASRENPQVTFQDPPIKRGLSSTHPAFRQRPASGRAGDVVALDHQIIRNGGTTSTYEQLPHRLQIWKHQHPITLGERVVELTRTNGYLLQELAFHKDTQAADMEFYETVRELHRKLEDALKERSRKRANAESTLLGYWGIDFGDGNVEDTVF